MDNNFEDIIAQTLEVNTIAVSGEALPKLARLVDLLLEANRRVNLTAIKTPEDAALLHIADSLTLLHYLFDGAKLIDVGCGAGFPALPVAVAGPAVEVTALDATGKKVEFAATTARSLALENFTALCGRAEGLGVKPDYRERYDLVSARAVAGLNVLCELCLPFIRVGGRFLAMKSVSAGEEIARARHALSEMGGIISENKTLTLRGNDPGNREIVRNIIIIQKVMPTPKIYPRGFAHISKKPL